MNDVLFYNSFRKLATKVKCSTLLGLFVLVASGYAQPNPYSKLTFDSLIIYDFDWRARDGSRILSILDENGKLASTVKKSVKLSAKEAQELSSKIGSKDSYGQLTAACFDPHFGMVYYRKGKPIAHVTICLRCNYPRSSLKIPARNQGGEEMEDGSIYYVLNGFSKSFRKYLDDLKERYDFSARILEGSSFD